MVESDVRNVDWSCVTDEIDLLAGGPPCQPFSLGGLARAAQINLKRENASDLSLRAAYLLDLRYHFRRVFVFRRDYFFASQKETVRKNSAKSTAGYLKRRDKDNAALRFAARSNGRYDDRRQGRLQGGRTFRLKFANRVYDKGLRRVYRACGRCCKFDVQILL